MESSTVSVELSVEYSTVAMESSMEKVGEVPMEVISTSIEERASCHVSMESAGELIKLP